ncbi:pyridoxal-phosphate dependent enzyme [Kitasatospora sp. NPDC051170]|uniref:pyridoxal-phosphate dependent enzyme n=1 Tax=Kitasatospora sp. NPDC051170 TaxID=3364056 RepID=UPI0037A87443
MELYREDESVVRRYAEHLEGVDPDVLRRVSLREGARIVRLPSYRRVGIDVLDLSTLSTTGTFKDWVACVAVARAVRDGHPVVAAQSSGNTANALATYASRAGIRLVALHPPASRRRIHPRLARRPGVTFVEVSATEHEIKEILRDATRATATPSLPVLRDQFEGNKLRAHFLRDAGRAVGHGWDWHVQALSSAYGPLGFYRGLAEAYPAGHAEPRFLGVQQEAVAPYVRALTGTVTEPGAEMLEPTLFRKVLTPELIAQVRDICHRTDGAVHCLPNQDYLSREAKAIDLLSGAGVEVTPTPEGQPVERAGLYSLAGTLQAIDDGTIPPGDRALAVYTGGSGPSTEPYVPQHVVTREEATDLLKELLTREASL